MSQSGFGWIPSNRRPMKIPTALGRYSSFSVVSRKAHNLFDTFFPLKMLKLIRKRNWAFYLLDEFLYRN